MHIVGNQSSVILGHWSFNTFYGMDTILVWADMSVGKGR